MGRLAGRVILRQPAAEKRVRLDHSVRSVHSLWVQYPEVYPPLAAPEATRACFGLVGETGPKRIASRRPQASHSGTKTCVRSGGAEDEGAERASRSMQDF